MVWLSGCHTDTAPTSRRKMTYTLVVILSGADGRGRVSRARATSPATRMC